MGVVAGSALLVDTLVRRGERAPAIAARKTDGADPADRIAVLATGRPAHERSAGATTEAPNGRGDDGESAADEARLSETERKAVTSFVGNASQRFAAVGKLSADVALEQLPTEFCGLYPEECAALRLAGSAPLATVLVPPDEEELRALCSRGTALASIVEGRELQELFETIRAFYSREGKTARGELPPISLAEHLGPRAELIDARLEHPARTWALLDEYERTMVDAWARREHAKSERDLTAIEADLHPLFWEHRCRLDNAMIAELPPRIGVWFHLGRVLNRVALDDSYWMPADELAAVERRYPDWLR